MIVDPTKVTNYKRSEEELQFFYLFCILVAGKNASWAATKISEFFIFKPKYQTPFQYIKKNAIALRNMLVANKIGQYNRIEKAFLQSVDLDLKTVGLDDLVKIFGVGPKTARFFLLHSREDCEYAVLDTHILQWMRSVGFENAPEKTPSTLYGEYQYWEKMFLKMIKVRFRGLTTAQADLMIWMQMSGRLENDEMILQTVALEPDDLLGIPAVKE